MLAFILIAAAAGLIGSISALVAGASVWAALALYVGTGVISMLLVIVRAFICDILQEAGMLGRSSGAGRGTHHGL